MANRKTVDEKIAELESPSSDPTERSARIARALTDRHYSVVAKAARLAEDGLLYDLVPVLRKEYARFLERPAKADPSCIAKKAIARALVGLDCNDASFYIAGLSYRQPEPVWGGTVDTAVDVRCSCAMGLVASGHPRALVELAELLSDLEPPARAGAVRAIACGNPREAELLLRGKILAGDEEPAVIGECFTALLSVEPDESIAFVARYLRHPDEELRELAALALGESRLPSALPHLETAWTDVLLSDGFRRALLRAAAAHRSEAAFDWLLAIVAEARSKVAAEIVEALAIYKHNSKLARRLETVVAERGDAALQEEFTRYWERGSGVD
jgi:HEAT repeat protein